MPNIPPPLLFKQQLNVRSEGALSSRKLPERLQWRDRTTRVKHGPSRSGEDRLGTTLTLAWDEEQERHSGLKELSTRVAPTSLAFGGDGALTLDEFALWLNLEDDYWTKQGRESIDAVMMFGALLALSVLGKGFAKVAAKLPVARSHAPA